MVAFLLALLIGCGRPKVGPLEGERAPPIASIDVDGRSLSVQQFSGKPVVLVFWASWCGPCRREVPAVARLAQSYGTRIQVIGINAGEARSTARQAARALGMTWPVMVDPDGRLQKRFQVTAIPLMLVIDKDGVIRYRGNGLPSNIHRLLDGLLQ